MSLFWKPSGMPVILHELKNGQHVEGYYKDTWSSQIFWRKVTHARVSVEDYKDYKSVYIFMPGGKKKRIGQLYNGGTWYQDRDYSWRLYDGFRYSKPSRRRILP